MIKTAASAVSLDGPREDQPTRTENFRPSTLDQKLYMWFNVKAEICETGMYIFQIVEIPKRKHWFPLRKSAGATLRQKYSIFVGHPPISAQTAQKMQLLALFGPVRCVIC